MGVDLTKKRSYDDMCEDCRDGRDPTDMASFCICPPKPEKVNDGLSQQFHDGQASSRDELNNDTLQIG